MGRERNHSSVNEKAELALLRLDEIDELMRSNPEGEQHVLTKYLKGGMDLHSILTQHDAELSSLREEFIQAHVDDAESICALYTEFVECEEKLVQFEEEIITFQRRLADTADDMVKMQQQTVSLVRSINNRRLASGKVNEVYTALEECDTFCEAISHKEVDKEYLDNIAELEKKLSFLSSNKELEGSAVDLETRPRLQAAASRAGDKLKRHLMKRIAALSSGDDLAVIAQRQRELADEAENAFSFLKNYNRPVASSIFQEYVRRMADLFARHMRASLRGFGDMCAAHAAPVEPIVTAEESADLVGNRDGGAPRGCHVTAAVPRFPALPLPRRERSVSQHMRTFADLVLKSDKPAAIRAATFADTVAALLAVDARGEEMMSIDAHAARALDETNCWAWHFLRCVRRLVDLCVGECRFISRFFCSAVVVAAAGGEVYDEAEALSRAVLGRALDAALHGVREDLLLVTQRESAVAGLRVVEMVKGHLCRLQDPVPLLLLSVLIEHAKSTLTSSLHEVMANDQTALQFVSTLRLTPFHIEPAAGKVGARGVVEDKGYAATLGPHPVVRKFAHMSGEMELLNCIPLAGSVVDGKDVLVMNSAVSGALYRQLEVIVQFVQTLAGRHRNPFAQRIFAVNNLFYILATWRKLATLLPESSIKQQEQSQQPMIYAAQPAHIACVESRLFNEVARFVDEDSKSNGIFGYLFTYIETAEGTLGSEFFVDNNTASDEFPIPTLPTSLDEAATLKTVTDFNHGWLSQLHETASTVKRVVASTMGAVTDKVAAQCTRELEQCILKEYTHGIVEANQKLYVVATKLFGKNGDIHAKLTSNATLLQEVKKVLQG